MATTNLLPSTPILGRLLTQYAITKDNTLTVKSGSDFPRKVHQLDSGANQGAFRLSKGWRARTHLPMRWIKVRDFPTAAEAFEHLIVMHNKTYRHLPELLIAYAP